MAEKIAIENCRISNFEKFVTLPWPWIGSCCIPSCITHRTLPTCQISLKSKKLFVDWWTYARTYVRTDEGPVETRWKSRPKIVTKLAGWSCLLNCYGPFSYTFRCCVRRHFTHSKETDKSMLYCQDTHKDHYEYLLYFVTPFPMQFLLNCYDP